MRKILTLLILLCACDFRFNKISYENYIYNKEKLLCNQINETIYIMCSRDMFNAYMKSLKLEGELTCEEISFFMLNFFDYTSTYTKELIYKSCLIRCAYSDSGIIPQAVCKET